MVAVDERGEFCGFFCVFEGFEDFFCSFLRILCFFFLKIVWVLFVDFVWIWPLVLRCPSLHWLFGWCSPL